MKHNELLELEYLSKKYDEANIPLYLSYPISSWWKTTVDEEVFRTEYSHAGDPFLYFHFPYCRKACFYCSCFKAISDDKNKNDIYIHHLEKEFLHKRNLLGISEFKPVKHLHWGGGTPTHLTLLQIEKIFNATSRYMTFADDTSSSISIEAYPDDKDLSYEKLKLLRELGFNEISFGIQDFDKRIQHVINRDTRKETVRTLIRTSKELGFRVHVDLCYGLPFQGLNELENTIKTVIEMAPDRVALFTYAHYPMAFPLQRNIPAASIPNSFMRVLMAKAAKELFEAGHYHKVGYDHFVKKGNALHAASTEKKVIRDFMGYSVEKRKQFIGFGSAAISFLGKGFFQNTLDLKKYYHAVKQNSLPVDKDSGHLLSYDDEIRNKLIQQHIMGDFKIDMATIAEQFKIDFRSYFKPELLRLEALNRDGLIAYEDSNTIILTSTGRYFARHVAHVFDNF